MTSMQQRWKRSANCRIAWSTPKPAPARWRRPLRAIRSANALMSTGESARHRVGVAPPSLSPRRPGGAAMNDDWATIRARRVLEKLSDGAAMNERVEEIRRQWSDNSGPKSPWTDVWDLLRAYDEQATALTQAEREREFERERADNQHEAAEMFQNQYREALQERDHSRGLVNGLIAERNDARAEGERLKADLKSLGASRGAAHTPSAGRRQR